MNLAAVIHESKSSLSYAYDKDTLHVRIKTAKDDVTKVTLIALEPFNWAPKKDDPTIYEFRYDEVQYINMEKEYTTDLYDCWFAEVKNFPWLRIKYCFILENSTEKYVVGCRDIIKYNENEKALDNLRNYYNFPYINEEDIYSSPEWVKDTVWYQIFPERFHNSSTINKKDILPWGSDDIDGYGKKFGGDLQGVIEKLDYIKECGFTGIYFTPIFESPSSHKYDTTDYLKIDPEFGNNETFKLLVEEAHKRGMKIMIDAVFNHCGFLHPFWQDVVKNGVNSKYYECFYVLDENKPIVQGDLINGLPKDCLKEDLNYRTFAFTQIMPKWNLSSEIARNYLLDVTRYWTEEYKIDGWRLDVSNEVSHDFWREFRKVVKDINPEVYILGENWDNSYPWLKGDQLDAVMNYEFTSSIWSYFGKGEENSPKYNSSQFKNAINNLLFMYPKNVAQNMFNLLDSHDTSRILTLCYDNVEILKLAYVFQMTFSGAPSIYYGSEVGMAGGTNSNRRCMIWEEDKQNKNLLETIKKLIILRGKYKSFKSVDLEWLYVDDDKNCIIYKKESMDEKLFIIINNSSNDVDIILPDEMKFNRYNDIYEDVNIDLKEEISLKSYSFRILLNI